MFSVLDRNRTKKHLNGTKAIAFVRSPRHILYISYRDFYRDKPAYKRSGRLYYSNVTILFIKSFFLTYTYIRASAARELYLIVEKKKISILRLNDELRCQKRFRRGDPFTRGFLNIFSFL